MKLTESHGREEYPLGKSAKPVALRCSAGFGDAVARKERSKNMKVLEHDCEAGATVKKLELSCKIAPLSVERNGTVERVTAAVRKGDETLMAIERKSIWVGNACLR